MDLLPTRGAKAFKLFVDALREDYEWLVDEIESAVNNPEPSDAIDSSKFENVRDTVWKKQEFALCTIWKLQKFSNTQIFREINFGGSRGEKSDIIAHLEAMNFDFYDFLHFLKA